MNHWTPDLETAARKGGRFSSHGSSCYFVALTPTTGLKLYAHPLERDASYVAQSVAAEYGIAPKTGQCVELRGLNIPRLHSPCWWLDEFRDCTPDILYGFMTEIVDVTTSKGTRQEASELIDAAREIGFYGMNQDVWEDHNTGRNAAGKLVITDWDPRLCGLLTRREVSAIEESFFKAYVF